MNSDVFQQHNNNDAQNQNNHWGENRLADVVKGTAKSKNNINNNNNNNSRETGHDIESPRATSPQQAPINSFHGAKQQTPVVQQEFSTESKDAAVGSEDVRTGNVTLTPPSSPEKLVVFLFLVFYRRKLVSSLFDVVCKIKL